MTVALSLRELTKTFSAESGERPALSPLTLDIDEGERVALVGHNGSGKTTMLKMAAGLLDPTGGQVLVGGAPGGTAPARAALAYLSDHPTFYDDLSLAEHLEYVARLHGVSQWQPKAEHLVTVLGLGTRIDDLPNTFSRGLKQKAAVTLAFIRPFRVLLVDEPFVGLDAAGRAALLVLLDEAAAAGSTLVVATHELSFVDRVDRLIALNDGEVVYDGPPGEADARSLVLG